MVGGVSVMMVMDVCLGGKCCDDIVVVYCERVGGVTTVQYMITR